MGLANKHPGDICQVAFKSTSNEFIPCRGMSRGTVRVRVRFKVRVRLGFGLELGLGLRVRVAERFRGTE